VASLEVFQDMVGKREDKVLKAFTGLEGGVVATGSTCGVVSGGAMGLALLHADEIIEKGMQAQTGLLSLIGEYVKWFEEKYGSSFCRKRTGVDFYSTMGQLRYFMPGDRVSKCLWHIRGATRHLYSFRQKELPMMEMESEEKQDESIHCAQLVLKGIKEQTGIGDDLLERLSLVFDGGIGLQGGACGALIGAIMGINLIIGMNVHDMNYFQILKAFAVGHKNLLTNRPVEKPEPFKIGKEIVKSFKEEAGSTECQTITGKKFSDWSDFQNYISSSDKCFGLIELAKDQASTAIKKCLSEPK
jgi:C_GCAxxG_C_C family probable redox protein